MAIRGKNIAIILVLVIVPLTFLWSGLLINAQVQLVGGQTNANQKTNVLYLVGSPDFSKGYTDQIYEALKLDSNTISVTMLGSTTGIDFASQTDYDVVFLNDYVLSPAEQNGLKDWLVEEGHGLIVVMGAQLSTSGELFDALNIIPGQISFSIGRTELFEYETTPHPVPALSVLNEDSTSHLTKSIAWNSAPELLNYTHLSNWDSNPSNNLVVSLGFANGTVSDDALLFTTSLLSDKLYDNVIIFGGWIHPNANKEFQLWPYFNYLFFNAVQGAINRPIPTYDDWQYSPVPHLIEQIGLGLIVLICGIGGVLIFKRKQKKGTSARKKYETIEKLEDDLAKQNFEGSMLDFLNQKTSRGEPLSDHEQEIMKGESLENLTIKKIQQESKEDEKKSASKWEEIGFHRQQAGFMQMFYTLIFLVIPQLIISSFVMPQFIQPHPQAGGYYSFTLHFFEAIWIIFDMGMRYAFVKYFAEYRIEQPERAFHYAQIFVWWQLLSGIGQLTMFTFFGSLIFPRTSYAYLTWIFIVHSLIQFPGIFQVLQYFFQAMQKTDKQMITFVLQMFLLRLVAQVITVPIFRGIYAEQMVYGDALGAGLGLIVGQYIGDIIMFLITLVWYRQMQLSFAPIFAVEFTSKEFIKSLKFGAKMAMGEMLVPLVWLLQVVLVSLYIPNYAAEQGYYELANTIGSITAATAIMYEGTFGALTEAHTYKKNTLLNYTTGASMRLGMFWTFFLCAALLAIGPMFIIGTAGPGWRRAADLVPLFVLFNIIGPFSWQGDKEFASAERPELAGFSWIVEQSLRAILMFVLLMVVPIMEMVIIAYIIALIVKDIVVWIIIEKKIHRHSWYPWATFIAPGIGAILIYVILYLITKLVSPNLITVLLIFVLTFFIFLNVYSFFVGFFGGYDKNTIQEFEKSAYMTTGPAGFFSRLLFKSANAGTRISPLHNRFPITIYEDAYIEANELNSFKKKLY